MKKILRLVVISVVTIVATIIVLAEFNFQTAPVPLPPGQMIAYRIVGSETDGRLFANDPDTIHGYAIVQQRVITDPELQKDVIGLLNSRFIYGLLDTMCFEPGIAIRMGEGASVVDALICLDCDHIYFFHGDKVEAVNLNQVGAARIKRLYPRLFPGHWVSGPNDDAAKTKTERDEERKRREEILYRSQQPSSMPATAPQ